MAVEKLDSARKQDVSYCIPLWLRNEQIAMASARALPRIEAHYALRHEPIALVCYGPSLNDTWQQVKSFKYIMTCSGAHKFLVERGVIPTWHVEVDPREHKVTLIGQPQQKTQYLIASTCHPAVFDHLSGYDVRLWHVFDNAEDGLRTLPHGEWALPGGCSVGLRTMTIARFFGFTDQHIFGMDGSEGETGKHAASHPNQQPIHYLTEYPEGSGTMWKTTPSMLEAARGTWHELNQMPDVKATFYGQGLVQEMSKYYIPAPAEKGKAIIGFYKPDVISAEYRSLNEQLHKSNLAYGVGGGKHAPTVLKLAASIKTHSILDYGCGKGYLSKEIPFPIWEYDPAVPGKSASPRPADLVVCTDVLEHIEPEKLPVVLDDIRRCTKQVAYLTIHTGPARKTLPDGRNTHLIQQGKDWWAGELSKYFTVGKMVEVGPELICVVAPKVGKQVMVMA